MIAGMGIWKRVKTFIWYHTGTKDFVSKDKMTDFIPDVLFDSKVILYIVKYKPEYQVYTMIVRQYEQGVDV